MTFDEFFKRATRVKAGPYPYQERLATGPNFPELLNVPTGLGKTAAVILAWLWRRRFSQDGEIRTQTPRRLVYCLPMRVLVEQTHENAIRWLDNLGLLAGTAQWGDADQMKGLQQYTPEPELSFLPNGWAKQHGDDGIPIAVHFLMGGEEKTDWALWPERDAILIGTQDMLLSRALNRGYAAGRARWPMEFGLLHNDSLWVFDEIQLMGSGLATTAQLEAFRRNLRAKERRSLWMSATLQQDWLRTVDFDAGSSGRQELTDADKETESLRRRHDAPKPLRKALSSMSQAGPLAQEVLKAHIKRTRTLVVVNTVQRARELYREIEKVIPKAPEGPELVLIHSRFRPADRKEKVHQLLAAPRESGTIAVSTQVVEAGVDVSATVLFTDLAPWSSLVQRFGRCNRFGTDFEARVFWIDFSRKEESNEGEKTQTDNEKEACPYDIEELRQARGQLQQLTDAGPAHLPVLKLAYRHSHVIRRKDLLDLFDTTPDLAGNDIDIDRYVREVEESDVQLIWRVWTLDAAPDPAMPAPRRDELCPAPVGEFRVFVKRKNRSRQVYRWDYLKREWLRLELDRICPGQLYLLHSDAGGYSASRGWDASLNEQVEPVAVPETQPMDSNGADELSQMAWQSIAEHTDRVCQELHTILSSINVAEAAVLRLAGRWHDRGKAHVIFQRAIRQQQTSEEARPSARRERTDLAKAPPGWWQKYERKHFRHELASALSVLLASPEELDLKGLPNQESLRDLLGYLVAAHHGKVRVSIRSLPGETSPRNQKGEPQTQVRFARGIWDGDELPAADLGSGITAPVVKLSLEPMEMGLCQEQPFAGQSSWVERMLELRGAIGPFRLAFLEALLRAADCRASR